MVSDVPFRGAQWETAGCCGYWYAQKECWRSAVGWIRAESYQNMALILMYHVLLCRYMFLVDYHDTDLQESLHKSYHATPWIQIILSNYYMKITTKLWTATVSISLSAADFLSRNLFENRLKDCILRLIKWVFSRYPRGHKPHNGDLAGFYIPDALEGTVRTQEKFVAI